MRRQGGVHRQLLGRPAPRPRQSQPADRRLPHAQLAGQLRPGEVPRAPAQALGLERPGTGTGTGPGVQRRPALLAGAATVPPDREHDERRGGGQQRGEAEQAHGAPLDALHGLGRGTLLGGLVLLGRLGGLVLAGALLAALALLLGGRGLGGVLGRLGLLRVGSLLGDLGGAHAVRGRGGGGLEPHPAVLGAEPHLGPGVGVAGGDHVLVPVDVPCREPDDDPGGISLGGHHQGEGGGELLAVADPVLEEGIQRVLAGRGADREGVREGGAEVLLEGDRGVEAVLRPGVVHELLRELGRGLRHLVLRGVAGREGGADRLGGDGAQLLGGGGALLGEHGVVLAGQVRGHELEPRLAVGGLQRDRAAQRGAARVHLPHVLRHRQPVTAQALQLHVGLLEVAAVGVHRGPVLARVGEGGDPEHGLLPALIGPVGLPVEAVQGAQAQVGGVLGGGGVAQHLGVGLLEQGAAHGDLVVDHHRAQPRRVGVLPAFQHVHVQRDPGREQLRQRRAEQRGETGDEHHAQHGHAGGPAGARHGPRLGSAVTLEIARIAVDGAGGEDRGGRGEGAGDVPPRPARGLLEGRHEQRPAEQERGRGVPAEVEVHQVQQQGEQRRQRHDDHDPRRAEGERRQARGELLHALSQHLRLRRGDGERALRPGREALCRLHREQQHRHQAQLQHRHQHRAGQQAAQHHPAQHDGCRAGQGQQQPGRSLQQLRDGRRGEQQRAEEQQRPAQEMPALEGGTAHERAHRSSSRALVSRSSRVSAELPLTSVHAPRRERRGGRSARTAACSAARRAACSSWA